IVYVGAVMVLFLFVVMMLRVDPAKMRAQGRAALPLGLLVAGVLMAEMAAVALSFAALPGAASPAFALPEGVTDARALGRVLYTDFVYPFQVAGLILLIAMVGAIALTQRARPDIKRQSVADQTARRPGDAMEIVKVTPRTGA
ncbi:MAG TPA: NADH-quinone oxidoreductase subunit J, partial [Rhodospirillaceae bacterium]|nr:NADH-quinone oxidoreductase subunit J [Rhodospirillaceae bacterium]